MDSSDESDDDEESRHHIDLDDSEESGSAKVQPENEAQILLSTRRDPASQ